MKPPRLNPKRIRERLIAQLGRFDRTPFQDLLATAVLAGQGTKARKAWTELAERDPAKYASAISSLAKPAGFGERTESVQIGVTPEQLVAELMGRYGAERARMMLEASGIPVALIDQELARRVAAIPAVAQVERG